ncbi:MAG: metallophosphoesterase [Sphingomonadales bacterium]|jgi:Icc-related predicted phosphoesterase
MRILAISDLHLSSKAASTLVEAAEHADVVVIAGDFAQKGRGLEDYMRRLFAINTPTVVVPGNHEKLSALQKACCGWEAAHVLHGSSWTIDGQTFFGLGYEFPRCCYDEWNQYLDEAKAAEMLKACPDNAVLITHVPAFGIGDKQRDGTHEGSEALRLFLERNQIRLHLCGHIHFAWGSGGPIGTCWSQNLGPKPNWFRFS